MRDPGNRILVGRSIYDHALVHVGGSNHMLTFAGARGGKGSTASIPNLLEWPHSALVIDVKGTHAAVTARYRRDVLGQRVYIVDPFHVVQGESDGFDPLSSLDVTSHDIRERIAVIGDALVVPDSGVRDPHWDEGARTTINGLIDQRITDPVYQTNGASPSLPMIRDMLSMIPDKQDELWANMSLNASAAGLARDAATRIIRGIGTNEILSILSSADKHTEWLSSGPMRNVLTKPTFTFAEMKERPTTIYCVLPPHYLDTHKRFLRLFINLAINQMSIGGRSRIPVLMILDEFLACGFMSEVVKAFGLMAGYNLVVWPFVQDLGSLRDLYKNRVNAFINNSRAIQVFAISDEETTKFASNRIGERSMQYVAGMGDSMRTPLLRTPAEVAKEVSADSGYQYILRAGKAPLLLEKVPYYEDQLRWKPDAHLPVWLMKRRYPFCGKYDADPDFE